MKRKITIVKNQFHVHREAVFIRYFGGIMQSSAIERIIGNDRKAREAVAAAKKHQKETAEKIALKKAELEAEMKGELADMAKAAMESSKRKNNRLTEEYRKNAGMICTAMETLYKEKKAEWIETYTSRIINGK